MRSLCNLHAVVSHQVQRAQALMLAHEGKGLLMRGEGAKVEAKAVDGVRLHFFPFVGTSLAGGSDIEAQKIGRNRTRRKTF